MQDDYFSFLDLRAAQRRLGAKFARPRALMINTLLFVTVMTAIWAVMLAWRGVWHTSLDYTLPVIIGVVWSVLLAVHGLVHYRRSAALTEKREVAVEEEMRQFIEEHTGEVDQSDLFAMHRTLETDLQRWGRWSLGLMAFALVNALSWLVSSLNIGSSWPFTMTLPLAIFVIGGVAVFTTWQQQRQLEQRGWFTRLPLRHIAAYLFGVVGLALLSGYRLINNETGDLVIRYWMIALVLHILVGEIVQPLLAHFLAREQQAKRKPAEPLQLVLGDDGEVLDLVEQDAQQVQTNTL